MNKILLLPIFALLLIFAASFGESEAAKSQGTKNPETGSDKVCGDKLCSEIQTHSTFTVGGVAQQASFTKTGSTSAIDYSASKIRGDISYSGKVTICHNDYKTKDVSQSQVKKHQRHGDTLGECPIVQYTVNGKTTICNEGSEMEIKERQWRNYKKHGATLGACDDVKSVKSIKTNNSSSVGS